MNKVSLVNLVRINDEMQVKLTLWLNHLLVLYAFLIPINNKAKSSLFFVILILFLYRRNFIKYLKPVFQNKIIQALLAFYIVHLFGFIYTENIEFAKETMDKVKYILFPIIFLSFLDKRFSFRIIMAFILGMFFSILISYGIYFEFFPTALEIGKFEIYEVEGSSPSPFFNHIDHNIGIAIMVAILLYLAINAKDSKLLTRSIYLGLAAIAIINMSFLGGRTGYVLFLILMISVFVISYKRDLKKLLIILTISILSILLLSGEYSQTIQKKMLQTEESIVKMLDQGDYNSSVGLRVGFTMYSLDIIKDNPIFGVGTGDYMDEVRSLFDEEHLYLNKIAQPHNVYIKILLQFGLIGFFLLLFLFYRLLSYEGCDNQHNKNIIILLTIAISVSMLPGKFFGVFVLPLFVTLLSALIVSEVRSINFTFMTLKLWLKYIIWIIVFLIIGITK